MEERQQIIVDAPSGIRRGRQITALIVLGLIIILSVWIFQLYLNFKEAKLSQVVQDVSGFATSVKDNITTEQINP